MDEDERAIRELITTWLEASKVGDTEKVLSLMADDVVFLMPGQPPMRGKAAFAESRAAITQLHIDATSEIREIKVFGGWAYTWTHLNVVASPIKGGASIKRTGHTLSILRKQPDGKWVLFRDANMLAVVTD
ncbi:MAG: SgcJ/EcaC family oxidoreductase [Armatimonadetes bacterium]|nr:SgcJ/EcaC family oxidoreductase [Armatimonadota bacterium]